MPCAASISPKNIYKSESTKNLLHVNITHKSESKWTKNRCKSENNIIWHMGKQTPIYHTINTFS
jgi:hypothetical protein